MLRKCEKNSSKNIFDVIDNYYLNANYLGYTK